VSSRPVEKMIVAVFVDLSHLRVNSEGGLVTFCDDALAVTGQLDPCVVGDIVCCMVLRDESESLDCLTLQPPSYRTMRVL